MLKDHFSRLFPGQLLCLLILLTASQIIQAETTTEQARSLARLYSAAFDRLPKVAGLNFWVDSLEAGRPIHDIAADFSASPEFRDKYGPLDDREFVEQLFRNVLGREGVTSGINFWEGRLAAGRPRGEILAAFADSEENVAKTRSIYASMRQDGDGDWLFTTLYPGGTLTVMLNGPVVDAQVSVSALNAPDSTLFSTRTSTSQVAGEVMGAQMWSALSPAERLAYLGSANMSFEASDNQFYLVTVTQGRDVDNDRNGVPDVGPTPVVGRWHALVTGEQLRSGGNITAVSEAVFQQVQPLLTDLSASGLQMELDRLAREVVADVDGDGAVDYRDVLAWGRYQTPSRLNTEIGDVDRLALAIQQASDDDTLFKLGARVVDGPPQVSLEDTTAVKREPDGTCEGRGAVVVSYGGESVTTKPPTKDCGDEDTGLVETTQSQQVGFLRPGNDGLPDEAKIDCADFSFSKGAVKDEVLVKLELKCAGNNDAYNATANDPDETKSDRLKKKYELLKQAQSDASAVLEVNPVVGSRNLYRTIPSDSGPAAANTANFEDSLAEAISYGALMSSWTSCLVYEVLAALVAEGNEIPGEVMSWAISGCTSALVEVDAWVEEAPASAVDDFEDTVPPIELDGCADCFAYIASPQDGASFMAGEPIQFTGVGPANNLGQRWILGDGTVADGYAVSHSYEEAGTYLARFEVDYADGTQGLESVQLLIEDEVVSGCTQPPAVTASYFDYTQTINFYANVIALRHSAQTFGPDCSIYDYRWEQVSGAPLVSILYDYCLSGICEDAFFPPEEATVLTFRVTVVDAEGNQSFDDVSVALQPVGQGCASGIGLLAEAEKHPQTNAFILDYSIDENALCDVVSYSWEQVSGSPGMDIQYDYYDEYYVGYVDGFFYPELEQDTDLTFRLTVTDDEGNQHVDDVDLTIPGNPQQFPQLYYLEVPGWLTLEAQYGTNSMTSCYVTFHRHYLVGEGGSLGIAGDDWYVTWDQGNNYELTSCSVPPAIDFSGTWPTFWETYPAATVGGNFDSTFTRGYESLTVEISPGNGTYYPAPQGDINASFVPDNYGVYDLLPVCLGPGCELPPVEGQ